MRTGNRGWRRAAPPSWTISPGGYDLFQKHQADIKPDPLELSKQEGEKEVYTFSVTLKTPDGKETATATGTITMKETEAGWMAANITLTVKEPYGR